jgi:hypothetical protein
VRRARARHYAADGGLDVALDGGEVEAVLPRERFEMGVGGEAHRVACGTQPCPEGDHRLHVAARAEGQDDDTHGVQYSTFRRRELVACGQRVRGL